MSQPFSRTMVFTLDKAHFQECFEQSAKPVQPGDYKKVVILAVLGGALMLLETEQYYIQFFILTLAAIEFFSIRFRQPWWVWRQLMGKAANGKVKLTVDEEGVVTESQYVNSRIPWEEVNAVEQTEKGLLLRHERGINYLSNSYLNEEVIAFIESKRPADLNV